MLFTISEVTDIEKKMMIKGVSPDDIESLEIVKVGKRGNYPGGRVFFTIEEANAHLDETICYELPANVPKSSETLNMAVVELDPGFGDGYTRTYWHRDGTRLRMESKMIKLHPMKAERYSFATGIYYRANVEEFVDTMNEVFAGERLLHDLPEFEYMCKGALTEDAGFKFVIEGPSTKTLMRAKLILAK